MLRGEPVALFVTVLYALVLASERIARVRALRAWPVLRELFPALALTLGAQCAAHWFTSVSELRSPKFLMCLAVSAALVLPTAAVPHPRARRIAAGVSIAVLSFLALADALYFRFFGGILPLLGTSTAKQGWAVMGSVVALFTTRDLVFVALLASGVWVAVSRGDAAPTDAKRLRTTVFRCVLAASLVGVVAVGVDVRTFLSARYSLAIYTWRQRLHETGVFGAHARDVARMVRASRKAGETPTAEKVRAISQYLDANHPPATAELFGVASGKNVIVVQVEAMQQWVIDARAHGVEITPFMNRLKRERALFFSGVWDQTLISPTADSEFLTLNSLHPMPDSATVFRFSGNDFVALPGILVHHGYSTLSAHAFERGFWNRATIHPRYGFQHSFFDRELGDTPKMGWGLADKQFLLRALERADQTRPPFMAFFITLTSHHPYDYVPTPERHIDTSGLPEILAGYVASMRYVDEALAGFFEALAKRPYAKDTMVVIYGDHESRITLDQAAAKQALGVLSLDAQTVSDLAKRSFATRKIPLFVVLPGVNEGKVFDHVGGQIDTSPTLLHLLGFPQPKSMMGRPLIGSGGAVFRGEGSAVEGDRVRLSDGNCRTLRGKGLPQADCESLARRSEEQLQTSWAITQYNLAERLSGERRASR